MVLKNPILKQCTDCPKEFEARAPNAKRCPECRERHNDRYALQISADGRPRYVSRKQPYELQCPICRQDKKVYVEDATLCYDCFQESVDAYEFLKKHIKPPYRVFFDTRTGKTHLQKTVEITTSLSSREVLDFITEQGLEDEVLKRA